MQHHECIRVDFAHGRRAAGALVAKGEKLITLEAMKMEHTLTSPFDGTVAEMNAVAGAQVQVDALLARIEASPAL